MSGREESWDRLKAEAWTTDPRFIAGLAAGGATVQSVTGGSGSYNYDEYAILVESLPPGATVSSFLMEMAGDLNGTVDDGIFNTINRFSKPPTTPPQVGQIISIDILGPDNGSVIIAKIEPTYFIFMTVTTPADGTHPEYGSREFGIEQEGELMRLYTRGCSRPGNIAIRVGGAAPQNIGWTRLCRGLSDTIDARGGKAQPGSFTAIKTDRE